MNWNFDESFPEAENRWHAWRPPFGRKIEGESNVRRAFWQWHPLDPILVSVPGAERALPPICFIELARTLQNRVIRQYRLLLLLIGCMTAGFAAAGLSMREPYFLKAGGAFALLFAFVILQYIFVFRSLPRLRTYSRFCSWCYLQPKSPVILIGLAMLFAGGAQVYLQAEAGSLFGLIEQYGLVFEKAAAQPWRYAIGPLLHSGPVHWIANFSLLLIAAGIAFALGRSGAVWVIFLAGVFVPAYALTYLPHWIGSDAFLGVSGGVFALFGWITGVAFGRSRAFPEGMWWLMGYFVVATIAVSSLLEPRASWFAHSFGLLLGFLPGALNAGMKLELTSKQ